MKKMLFAMLLLFLLASIACSTATMTPVPTPVDQLKLKDGGSLALTGTKQPDGSWQLGTVSVKDKDGKIFLEFRANGTKIDVYDSGTSSASYSMLTKTDTYTLVEGDPKPIWVPSSDGKDYESGGYLLLLKSKLYWVPPINENSTNG